MTTGQDQILSAVRTTLAIHRGCEGHVCVGLSGGLDSVVLLYALAQLRDETPFQLSALHVHHGLSPNADQWAAFCRSLCEELRISCEVIRLELPDSSGKGLERVAREARYEAFAAAPGDILCLAHHQNDRAETLLLNLFRGSGATGLVGVPNVRQLGQKTLVRPFFEISRAALVAWATARQLRWIEDESNQNLAFRRNYVRHRILPAIAEMYPGVVSVLARTSAQMSEQAALLNRLAEHDAQLCRDQEGYLSVSRLQQLPEAAVRNILRYRFAGVGIQIPAARRLREFSAQLMMAQSDSEAFVRMGSIGVHLWRDRIWIDRAMDQRCPSPVALRNGIFDWPDGQLEIAGVVANDDGLHIVPLGHGQRFHPEGRCHDRVSELLREKGVPPWVRPRLPGLWREGALVWVAHLGWSDRVEQKLFNAQSQLVWKPCYGMSL
ncbi:MAG: tRNA(Ile)-lysidine synthase [Pseudomonadota bacterium]